VGVLIALWQAGRQVYFVGTEEHGLVALYRGLPYEGPFGISLYEQVAVTSVPARTIGAERRERILDHELRSREDAVDLVVQLEQGRIP
jgi:protein phosphatase